MDFDEVLATLSRALRFGINPSLEGIRTLTDAMDRPQTSFASVQVTGTNGKSSVTRLVAAIIAAHGLESGAYTSPHLESYAERVEIDGRPVTEADLARGVTAALSAAESAGGIDSFTEFELLTAAALWLMRDRRVDVACLEVGMGGRWDATSVVDPAVAVITGVGLDHTDRLGATVEAIAADKAYIIKAGSSVVLGPGTAHVARIFLDRAEGYELHPRFVAAWDDSSPVVEELTVRFTVRETPPVLGGRLRLDVRGAHARYDGLELTAPSYQAANVATAVAAAECALGRALDIAALRASLAAMRFPGRFETVSLHPPIVLDGAHNPQAAGVLAGAVREAWRGDRGPLCVIGVLEDKDAAGIVASLAPVVSGFVVTRPAVPRGRMSEALASIVRDAGATVVAVTGDVRSALSVALREAGTAGMLVTGSLYTVGEARSLLREGQSSV